MDASAYSFGVDMLGTTPRRRQMDQTEEEGESVIVAQFPKNNREVICTGINEYRGKTYVFIRAYVPSLSGELTPTRDGISLSIDIQGVKNVGDVMSSDKVVAQIKKNSKEEIRIGLNLYKDIPLIQIRTYAAYGEGDEYTATKKGVAMNVNLLPLLLESIDQLSSAVASLKTVDTANVPK
jgi:hypothetical protein